jgi:hypothetical protein
MAYCGVGIDKTTIQFARATICAGYAVSVLFDVTAASDTRREWNEAWSGQCRNASMAVRTHNRTRLVYT